MLKKRFLRKSLIGGLAIAGTMMLAGCGDANESGEVAENNNASETNEDNRLLYFLPIEDMGAYWSVMVAGAESMAEELGFDLITRAAPTTSNQANEQQIGFVREGIGENAAAIALAPRDPDMLDRVAAEVRDAGIPLITFDSDVATMENRLSYVGTNNTSAGEILGQNAAQYLIDQGITEGSVALVMTNLTQTTFVERQDGIKAGFNEVMGDNANNFTWLEPIADDNQSATSLRQLQGQIVANPDMVAVFSLGAEGPTTGVMEALRSQNRGGEIFHFGFDFTETWLNGIEEGLITAIVNQDAFEIGRQTVRTMVDIVEGRDVEENYAIPVTWVLAEDIEAHGEEIQARMGE